MALAHEIEAQQFADLRVVVDDENVGHGGQCMTAA
jgi:hypothetical protein